MRQRLSLALLACLWASPALAQSASVSITDLSANTTACVSGTPCGAIGTTAQICVPVSPSAGIPSGITSLFFFNTGSNPVDFGYSPGITYGGVGTTRVVNAGGTGSQWAFWPAGSAPRRPLYCISTGGGSTLTILVGSP